MNWLQEFRVVFLNCYGYDLFSKLSLAGWLAGLSLIWVLVGVSVVIEQCLPQGVYPNINGYLLAVIWFAVPLLCFYVALTNKAMRTQNALFFKAIKPEVQFARLSRLSISKFSIWIYQQFVSLILLPFYIVLSFLLPMSLVIDLEVQDWLLIASIYICYAHIMSLARFNLTSNGIAVTLVVAELALASGAIYLIKQGELWVFSILISMLLLLQIIGFKRFTNMEIAK